MSSLCPPPEIGLAAPSLSDEVSPRPGGKDAIPSLDGDGIGVGDTPGRHHSNSRITSSTFRLAPAVALMVLTTPLRSAFRMFSIFIASTVASAWPS